MSTKGLTRSIERVILGIAKQGFLVVAIAGAVIYPATPTVTKADMDVKLDGHAESTTQAVLISVPNLTIASDEPVSSEKLAPKKKVFVASFAKSARPATVVDRMNLRITAYTSSPEETDSTPDITASGSRTRDGVVATNLLPFGTRVRIPSLFGNKIFTVEDRMHPRMTNGLDVWVQTKVEAFRIGAQNLEVEIID